MQCTTPNLPKGLLLATKWTKKCGFCRRVEWGGGEGVRDPLFSWFPYLLTFLRPKFQLPTFQTFFLSSFFFLGGGLVVTPLIWTRFTINSQQKANNLVNNFFIAQSVPCRPFQILTNKKTKRKLVILWYTQIYNSELTCIHETKQYHQVLNRH